MVVISIGLSLVFPDSITASINSIPFARNLFIESIKIIPLLTTIPPRIITPSITTTLIEVCVRNKAPNTPIRDKGTVNMIIKGCHKDSNCEAIIMYTRIIDNSKANLKDLKDSFICWLSPDKDMLISFSSAFESLTCLTFSLSTLSINAFISAVTLSKALFPMFAVTRTTLC